MAIGKFFSINKNQIVNSVEINEIVKVIIKENEVYWYKN